MSAPLPSRLRGFLMLAAIAALALAGCDGGTQNPTDGGDDGGSDGGGDGYRPQWAFGTPDTFEVATWNIENFPHSASAPVLVGQLLLDFDIDLVAVEEVADERAFADAVGSLTGYTTLLSPDEYSPGEYQKTGFIYRNALLRRIATSSLYTTDSYAFPRPPLQTEFELTPPGGNPLPLIVIVTHLKAGTAADDAARRREACGKLKLHIDGLLQADPTRAVMLVGDLNDELGDPPADNVFSALLADGANYRFLTQALDSAGEYSYIPYASLIDHVVVTAPLFAGTSAAEALALPLDDWIVEYRYEDAVSDHRPVVVRWPFGW